MGCECTCCSTSSTGRTEMAFRNIDPKTLEDGKFVYHSGEVSDSPCDEPRD